MSHLRLMSPFAGLLLLAGCSSTAPAPAPAPRPGLPNREAAVRVLNTMKEKITAAEELVQLREQRVQNAEAQHSAGRGTFAEMASAHTKLWDARIRTLNYKQDLYVAEAAMPLLMETVREKVVVAERAVEVREELVVRAQSLYESGRGAIEDVDTLRTQLMEDRIRVLNFRQELYTAEAVFEMAGIRDAR